MKTFIFDLDDTLVYNSYHFVPSTLKVCREVIRRIDRKNEELDPLDDIINMPLDQMREQSLLKIRPKIEDLPFTSLIFDSITTSDAEHVKQLIAENHPNPFGLEGMAETYYDKFKFFVTDFDGRMYEDDEDTIYNITYETFIVTKEFMTGAEEVLDFLKENGDELILMTKGDPDWQKKKIEVHNLEDWFSEVHIVGQKTPHLLKNLIKYNLKDDTYKVGNSMKSDVLPALEAGIKAIYLPFDTWAFEGKENHNIDHKKVLKMNCLQEIKYNYPLL